MTNPTPYALLDWDFTGGITIESLISPVINLANCTTAILRCSTYFDHRIDSYTAKLVGSINGGATFPYLIKDYAGSDFGPGVESFNITSWAAEQPRVKFAWVYTGGVNRIDFWAVDNIRVFGLPGFEHDIGVTEVRVPSGIIPNNTRQRPKVIVSNFGNYQETLKVFCRIDELYSDSAYVALPPAKSAIVKFDEWLATVGNHTIKSYAKLINDENRANDTAVATFQVVANTWINKERALAAVKTGGAITATADKLYALTGYPNMAFLRYSPEDNQWRRRLMMQSEELL
ncbi:MAG: hypothetical protein ABIK93_05675 [candidate division WOR-3 bacterium]